MSSSKRRCQPTSSIEFRPAAKYKLGFAAICVVFAGCSADVTRFDLGNPGVASGYAPGASGGSSSNSYGRDPSYGSAGNDNAYSTSSPSQPRSYASNGVSRSELEPPRETSALPPPTDQGG